MKANSAQLICLYGVVRAADRPYRRVPADLDTIVVGRLAALVEPVPAEELQPAALAADRTSVEWVSRVARRHEALIEAVMETCPVIPARVGTLFSGDEAVCRLLAGNQDTLVALLDRLVDREEHALRVRCDEVALRRFVAETHEAARSLTAAAAASPRQAEVLLRRRDALVAQLAGRRIEEVQERVLDVLEALDIEVRLKSMSSDSPATRAGRTVLHLAVLVERGGREHLDEGLDEFAGELVAEGFSFEQGGPWPPYSFASRCGEDLEVA